MANTTLPGVLLPAAIHASRPAANAVAGGTLFPCTTHSTIDQSDGVSTWTTWANAGSTATRASLGLDTTDSPEFAGLNVGAATDTTITRTGAGEIAVEGNRIFRVGGADVPVADGGTGASTASGARTNLGLVLGTDVASLTAGVVPIAQLATGTPDGTKFIRDDGVLATPAGGGGGGSGSLTLLESHTASSSASLDFTTRNAAGQSGAIFQSDFDDYLIELIAIMPATNGAMLLLRAGTGGGPTYDSGSNYPCSDTAQLTSNGSTSNYGTTATGIQFHNDTAGGSLSSTGTPALAGRMHLFDPASSTNHKRVTWEGIIQYYSGGGVYGVRGFGFYNQTTALTAIQFVMSSGNIASGTIRVYGLAK